MDLPDAPPAYREVEWLFDSFVALVGVGWGLNYLGMVYTCFRDHTYSMAILPLCSNIAWEAVYTVIYPTTNPVELVVYMGGLFIDFAVVYAAIVCSPQEWAHAPLVADNLPLIFFLGICCCLSGHLALAWEIGPSVGYWWGAAFCQLILSIGALAQLVTRGSQRGGSYTLWLSRFLGSICGWAAASIRCIYWPEAFSWMGGPLGLWFIATFLVVDTSYGVVFWYIGRLPEQRKKEKGK